MSELKMEDLVETPETSSEAPAEETVETPETDLLKPELERIKGGGKTEVEKAAFSLRKNADKVRELGGNPEEILGITQEPKVESDDDRPLTVGEFRKIEASRAVKTALQLADEISDPSEREMAKHYLENRIVPSGNPQDDFKLALGMVNSVKNDLIIKEQARRNPPKTHSSASGAPLKTTEAEQELTPAEVEMMKFGHLTKEQVLKTRQ